MDPCTVDPGGLDPGKDLPLMANTTDILVKHFILDLKVNFDERRFHGNIVLFCEPNIKGMKRSQPRVTCETTDVSGREDDDSVMSKRRAAGISSGNHRNLRDEITGEDSGQGQGDRGDDSHQCQSQQERTKPKILDGELLQSKDDDYRNPFYFTLDCRDITIKRVEEIVLTTSKETNDGCHTQEDINSTIDSGIVHQDNNIHTTNNIRDISDQVCGNHGNTDSHILEDILGFDGFDCKARNKAFWNCKDLPGNPLHFSMDPWCVRIWKDGVHDVIDFPAIVRIHYHSNPEGTSVSWAHDQDNNLCAFTQGTWINNRALFPCQEPPIAMATWQAIIHCPSQYVVLMSGDDEAVTQQQSDGVTSYCYHVNVPAPSSTLTVAIGQWSGVDIITNQQTYDTSYESNRSDVTPHCCHDNKWPCRIGRYDQSVLPCRIYAPSSILQKAIAEFGPCLPMYLQAVFTLLGPHPFSRLDLLIVPKCFSSLGMASPSIIFLSQSLLSGDHSMCIRLAHEISHSWFGLIIGARDWTEEWLSEGFATHMEDLIQAEAKQWSKEEQDQHSNLRSVIRYRALKAELENTEAELQTLRPSGVDTTGSESLDGEVTFVKNGLNHEKGFMQVHYIKGYFLLRHLAKLVGQSNFNQVIRNYVTKHHCQQVLSQELFQLYFGAFPHLRDQGITTETIYRDWLDHPGMPQDLNPDDFTQNNSLVEEVNVEFQKGLIIDRRNQKCKKSPRKKTKILFDSAEHKQLIPDQLVLLLEKLLELDTMSKSTLNQLDKTYNVSSGNADVRHRWCELLVKHQHRGRYDDVKKFLTEDQAMGVYLYGELMVAEQPQEKKLAQDCFLSVANEMDFGCHKIVREMIYGEDGVLESTTTDPGQTGHIVGHKSTSMVPDRL